MLLVFEYLFSQLISLIYQGLVFSLHSLIVTLTTLASQELLDLVRKVLVEVFGDFELLLYDFKLILKGFVQTFVFLILGSKTTGAFTS